MTDKIFRSTRPWAYPSLLLLVVCGCRPERGQLLTYMQPELLYLKDAESLGASKADQRRTLLNTLLQDPCPILRQMVRQALRK